MTKTADELLKDMVAACGDRGLGDSFEFASAYEAAREYLNPSAKPRETITIYSEITEDWGDKFKHAFMEHSNGTSRYTEVIRHVLETAERAPSVPVGSEYMTATYNAHIEKLTEELKVTEQLMNNYKSVVEAIPACDQHGSDCVSHALEWIKEHTNPPLDFCDHFVKYGRFPVNTEELYQAFKIRLQAEAGEAKSPGDVRTDLFAEQGSNLCTLHGGTSPLQKVPCPKCTRALEELGDNLFYRKILPSLRSIAAMLDDQSRFDSKATGLLNSINSIIAIATSYAP